MLGSASGLCYSKGAKVILHTITRTADERELVILKNDMHRKYKSVRKPTNITDHRKCDMPDLHWNNRSTDVGAGYKILLQEYVDVYGEKHVKNC